MTTESSQDRTIGLPTEVEHWSLATLREKLIKIGAKTLQRGRYGTFGIAEVALSSLLFAEALRLIAHLQLVALPP
ncbi:MAG: transposase [Alphaproteobacteria bacterium]|nr:transposase [Alphaproteobacteria bacterium]